MGYSWYPIINYFCVFFSNYFLRVVETRCTFNEFEENTIIQKFMILNYVSITLITCKINGKIQVNFTNCFIFLKKWMVHEKMHIG